MISFEKLSGILPLMINFGTLYEILSMFIDKISFEELDWSVVNPKPNSLIRFTSQND